MTVRISDVRQDDDAFRVRHLLSAVYVESEYVEIYNNDELSLIVSNQNLALSRRFD